MSDPKVRALVTGGSGALGAAICHRLGAMGHLVYVHANRNESAAQEVARNIRDAGGEAVAVAFDVTDAAATRAALDRILDEAPIQILVNNAAVHDDAAFPWHERHAVAARHRCLPERLLQRHAAAHAADDPHALGTHREHTPPSPHSSAIVVR